MYQTVSTAAPTGKHTHNSQLVKGILCKLTYFPQRYISPSEISFKYTSMPFLVQASLLGKGGRKGASVMFEDIAVSAGHLLLIIFGLILFFIIIYSALGVQASKRAKTV